VFEFGLEQMGAGVEKVTIEWTPFERLVDNMQIRSAQAYELHRDLVFGIHV
jgi:hypothetical protein